MRLGVSSFAFTWSVGVSGAMPPRPLDAFDLVDEARRLRVDVVQLADNVPLPNFTGPELAELAAASSASGVVLEVGARGLTASSLRRFVDIAATLNVQMLRFVIDGPGHHPPADGVVALLREHRSLLSDSAVTVALENHDRFAARQLRGVVDAVESAYVGICLDTVNSMGAGEGIREVVAALAPVTVNLHVKDYAVERREHGMGFTVTGARLGDGMLDLPGVLRDIATHGRCTTALLEQWAPRCATPTEAVALEREWVESGVDLLRRTLADNGLQPQHEGER